MKKLLILLFLLTPLFLPAQDGSIEFKGSKGRKISLDFNIKGLTDPDPVENRAIPIFMLIMGAGIVLIWMLDVANGRFRGQGPITNWKSEGGDRIWLHLLAEYLTAGILIAGAIGLLGQNGWGYDLSFVALGALAYTSLNSLAWTFADKSRTAFSIPMILGLAGSIISIVILLS
jgi:phosphoglycerol transferase MdoB-like AlkP superfamily enzyme